MKFPAKKLMKFFPINIEKGPTILSFHSMTLFMTKRGPDKSAKPKDLTFFIASIHSCCSSKELLSF